MNIWQVDAFTKEAFKGNPAAVVVTDQALPDDLMQKIAVEMNLSETAFVLMREGANPLLRWFTPKIEIDLCGHATLASAHVLFTDAPEEFKGIRFILEKAEVIFDTKFVGPLKVSLKDSLYTMDFPSRGGDKVDLATLPKELLQSLTDKKPKEAYLARDLMLVYEDENIIRQMKPNFQALMKFDKWIIVTSPSKKYDFISRFFNANDGDCEDAVTGSAHCTLGPYWSRRLEKSKLNAYQASARGGELFLDVKPDRVFISGHAVTVLTGKLEV